MTTEHLQPFAKGSERARELGRRGGQARAAKAAAKRDAAAATTQQAADALHTATQRFNRQDLAPHAAAAAQLIIGRVATGDIPVRNGDEAAALLRALVDVARLEEGQHTAATIIAHADTSQMLDRIRALRERASTELEATSTAAVAVADQNVGALAELDPAPMTVDQSEPGTTN